ncbi:hypothetical protein E3V36_05550 [Candidatus Marinimicrobia bacterium MT.SAG.2]|nr:hypothetical protein E3V36_05550 [Candidatus Marinimicrobia bacterium MT.SAG.2]
MRNINYLLSLLYILLQPLYLLAQIDDATSVSNQSDKHFRNATWGESPNIIINNETSEYIEGASTEDQKVFSDNISGVPMWIAYHFIQDKLTNARYMSSAEHTNKNDHLNEFEFLKKNLIQKYGVPKRDETLWLDDLFRDKHSKWGLAVSVGQLAYLVMWETDDTEIYLTLSGDNYKIKLLISYSSKKLKYLSDEKKKKSIEDQL